METKDNGPVANRTAITNIDALSFTISPDAFGTPAWQRTGGTTGDGSGRRKQLPVSMPSVLAGQTWFLKASPGRRREIVQAVQDAARRAAACRARVARHPDLTRRICQILGLKNFNQWNGYIPAPQRNGGAAGSGAPFDVSLVRRELLAILQDAADREGRR